MATLKSVFKLFDGYSSTINKINKKTDEATNKILKASGQTDKFNKTLNDTGASATKASSGLGKFLSIAALIAGAIKGMSIADEYTNTAARLNLINDGLQTQAELQDKIFAAANRSKGSYADMASAISKIGILAGDSFDSNDELIAFTELIQKSFKVGGASSSEQSSALLQLTQAMSAGKLQGDEFRSIMENAPMIADAIAKFTGKSKGELKEMSAKGTITADIIKNAMFAAGDDINAKFETLPMTFADVWNKIKNGGLQAFDAVIAKVNKLINTDSAQQFINGIIIGLDLISQAVFWLIDSVVSGWGTIGPILALITGLYLAAMIAKLWAMIPPLGAQAIAWLAVYWPILLIIAVIAILISAARQFGISWEEIFGFVGGVVGAFVTFFYNAFVMIWNAVAAFINFFGNVFKNPIASVQILFYDLMVAVLGFIETMLQGIEDLINKIPGVEIDITSGLSNFKDNIADKAQKIKNESEWEEIVKTKEFMDFSDGYSKGSSVGKQISNSIGDALEGFNKFDTSGTGNNPIVVEGAGSNGKVDVNMADEDLQYLRDIAEREYINKFSTATLAPNIQITFGDVHEEADANKVVGRIKKILQEEIATVAEGAYD